MRAAPQLFVTLAAALCVFAGLVVILFSGSGSSGTSTATSIEDRGATPPAAAELADATPTVADKTPVARADAPAPPELTTEVAPEATIASDKPATIVLSALPDVSQIVPTESSPVSNAPESTLDLAPDSNAVVSPIEILDECFVLQICVDHYLFALYERSVKVDTSKVIELRKVQVRKKRKMVTVTKRFTRLVPQDFTWKDPHAAEKAGMSMIDYVIGGMDRGFKLRLFQALRAAEKAGHAPGITSGFRDDYRQSIASGLRAAASKSFHGGSSRGGYGNGLAADVVGVEGATDAQRWTSTQSLWKWIDANEVEFGIGRPYLTRDPAHLAPIDGEEYASRRGTKGQRAIAALKKRNQLAARNDHATAQTKNRKLVRAGAAAQTAKQGTASGRPSGAAAKSKQIAGKT